MKSLRSAWKQILQEADVWRRLRSNMKLSQQSVERVVHAIPISYGRFHTTDPSLPLVFTPLDRQQLLHKVQDCPSHETRRMLKLIYDVATFRYAQVFFDVDAEDPEHDPEPPTRKVGKSTRLPNRK